VGGQSGSLACETALTDNGFVPSAYSSFWGHLSGIVTCGDTCRVIRDGSGEAISCDDEGQYGDEGPEEYVVHDKSSYKRHDVVRLSGLAI